MNPSFPPTSAKYECDQLLDQLARMRKDPKTGEISGKESGKDDRALALNVLVNGMREFFKQVPHNNETYIRQVRAQYRVTDQ